MPTIISLKDKGRINLIIPSINGSMKSSTGSTEHANPPSNIILKTVEILASFWFKLKSC